LTREKEYIGVDFLSLRPGVSNWSQYCVAIMQYVEPTSWLLV
jgi:hypothetical protein